MMSDDDVELIRSMLRLLKQALRRRPKRRRRGAKRKASPKTPSAQRLLIKTYAALHLLPGAPMPVIKAAYRALALIHHPDKGGSTRPMQRINAAFALLSRLARD
jgi:DnaJ-class molecular chaperone